MFPTGDILSINSLGMVFISSLKIFIIADLKASLGTVSFDSFCPLYEPHFPVFCLAHNFLLLLKLIS